MLPRTPVGRLLLSIASLVFWDPGAVAAPDLSADVIVVGATPAGIAAAVSAAQLGATVNIVELTDHVGGILSNGLASADVGNRRAVGGMYQEYTQRVLAHYRKTYGPDSPQVKACDGGHRYEPHVAEAVFAAMLEEQRPRIQVRYRHRLTKVLKEGNRVVGLVATDVASGAASVAISGKVCIDATYEGDLAARAGVRYRVGREGRNEYGEKHAGVIYTRFGKDELLPGSSGRGDAGIQAYNFRFCMTDQPDNRLPVPKPNGYDRRDYVNLLADFRAGRVKAFREAVQLHPVPNGKVDINNNHTSDEQRGPSESTDLAEENWSYPDGSDAERKRIFERTLSYGLGLIWCLQNDPEVPESIRTEASRWGLCKDEFIGNRHLPRQMYMRQARRIEGEYVLTERDAELAPGLQRPRPQPTSIAVATYSFDSHGVHKYDPAHPGVREGYIGVRHPPIQVPYGVLVPRVVDDLLVPVCCSASHVGYQTLRMEPLYMTLGQAAGTAAALAVRQQVRVRNVAIETLQRELLARKGVITFHDDVPAKRDAAGFLVHEFSSP